MSATQYRLSALGIDLGPKVFRSTSVAASPAAATETVVCTVTATGISASSAGVIVMGSGAFTMGTDGTGYTLKLRQTGTSGTTLISTGIIDLAATKLGTGSLVGFDAAPSTPSQVYVLTATITLGSAPSTFSGASLVAIVL